MIKRNMSRSKRLILSLVYLLGTLSLTIATSVPAAAQTVSEENEDVIVSFIGKPGKAEQMLINEIGGKVKTMYRIVPAIAASIPRGKIESLRKNPKVKSVEENVRVYVTGQVPTMNNDHSSVVQQSILPNKGTGVKIAILDTGIDLNHPDLKVVGNVTFVPWTTTGNDDNGHGTMVAGIVGALDNGTGPAGIAPEAYLYSVKVLGSTGSGSASVILSGIEWAVENNMQVINMSFGTPMNFPSTVVDALKIGYDAGIIIFAGAGNGGSPDGLGENIWSPARYDPVIAVGATTENNQRLSYSSTGSTLELMSPGSNIYTTTKGGGYGYVTGTSASSPYAAGAAAVVIRVGMGNNNYVRQALRTTALDLGDAGRDNQFGWGLVDGARAAALAPSDITPPTITISLTGTQGDQNWYRSDVQVRLTARDTGTGVILTQYSLDNGTNWNIYSAPFTVSAEGITRIAVKSSDYAGNVENPVISEVKVDKTLPNLSLIVDPTTIMRVNKKMVPVSYTGTVRDSVSGLNGEANIVLTDKEVSMNRNLGSALSGSVEVEAWCDANNRAAGRAYVFRLTARDLAGNEAFVEATATVVFRSSVSRKNRKF